MHRKKIQIATALSSFLALISFSVTFQFMTKITRGGASVALCQLLLLSLDECTAQVLSSLGCKAFLTTSLLLVTQAPWGTIALHVPSLFPPCALQGPRAYLTLAQAPRGTTMCCSGLGASLPLDLISGFRIRQASFCCLLQPIFSDFFQKYILTYFLFCTHPFEPQYKEWGDHKYVKVHSYVFSLLHPSFSTPISNPLTIRFQLDPKL